MPDSQTEISELAREVVDELKDTRQIGDQLLLSRREAIALSTGAVSLGALGVAGAGTASAQEAAGQIGTEADPVDVEGAQGNFSQAVSVDGALEAEEATIDGWTVGEHLTHIETVSVESDETSTITINSSKLNEFKDDGIILWAELSVADESDVNLIINDNESRYGYWDETGTFNGSENSFLLFQANDAFTPANGPIRIGVYGQTTDPRVTIKNNLAFPRGSRVDGFGERGGLDSSDNDFLDKIELSSSSDFRASRVIVYGVVR